MTSLSTSAFEKLLIDAITKRIEQIADEEIKIATERVRRRIISETASCGPEILRRLNWDFGSGEVVIKFKQ